MVSFKIRDVLIQNSNENDQLFLLIIFTARDDLIEIRMKMIQSQMLTSRKLVF